MLRVHLMPFALTLILVLPFVRAGGQTCSAPTFTQPAVYATGNTDIRALATADFDGDGRPDIAEVDMGSDNVTILTKLGGATAPSINSYGAGHFPVTVSAADLNGDGKPDLVIGNSDGILILINDGFPIFHAAGTVSPPQTPRSVVVGDFNGDGKLDVAAVAATGNMVIVLLGNGSGGFSASKTTSAVVNQLVAADFNGDGKLDLAGSGNPVQILFGNGDGTFTRQANSCVPIGSLDGIAAGDLNGDGKIDLALADIGAAQIHTLLNNGSGCFGAATNIDVLNQGRPRYITLADLNNDGKQDIIAGTTVLLGNGAGGFGAPSYFGSGSSGATPGSNTVVADFDADGKLDLGTASTNSVGILFGNGQGGFRYAVGPSGAGAYGNGHGDFNSDSKTDLVLGTSSGISLLLGDGAGGFSPPVKFATTSAPIAVAVADFNGDGKLDVTALDLSGRINTLLGDGAGHFAAPIVTTANGNNQFSLAVGDFNKDGKPDLLTANRLNGAVTVMLGDGTGHFSTGTLFSVDMASNPKQIGVADFNGDGKLDLAIPSGFGFSIMLGDGNGGFGPPTRITTANASSIITADFNGDGKTDLAMIGEGENKVSILIGNGSGSFGAPVRIAVPGFLEDLAAADFNGDGKLDLAVDGARGTNVPFSTASMLVGDGSGNFSLSQTLTVDSYPGWIIAGDFNADGRNDVITVNTVSDNISLMLNTCGGPVNSTPTIQFGSPVYSVGEGAGSATITVTRTGSTAGPASVSYATSDGSASSRSDYTSAFGTVRFADGETVKSFQVLITDDTTPESNESVNLTLSGVAGATLGVPSQATLVILDNDPTFLSTNPIDSPRFFAQQHYYDFLGRYPDQAGWDFWTNQITSCGTNQSCIDDKRNNVSASFFVSIEFQQTGYLVERMYKAAFGDATGTSTIGGTHQLAVPIVRFNEFLPDTQQIGQGVVVGQPGWETVLENNKQAFATDFVQRSRFTAAFPTTLTPAQFVDSLFVNAGVTPSSTDRNAAIAEFGSTTNTSDMVARGRALRRVAENTTLVTNEFNRAFVLMQYFGYLRRNPNDPPEASLDHSGYEFWLNKLNFFNGDYIKAEMVKAFITSFEYRNRFGP